jgi:hypothetical protein
MFATPKRKTFSALPVENPPPINDADMVAKITKGPNDLVTTAYSSRLPWWHPAHNPTPSTTAK